MQSISKTAILSLFPGYPAKRSGRIILPKSQGSTSFDLPPSTHSRYGGEVVQEEPSGAVLAQAKSDAYGNLDAKALLSVLVVVSG